jgi:regulator of cell morphogenesis and NO signaling
MPPLFDKLQGIARKARERVPVPPVVRAVLRRFNRFRAPPPAAPAPMPAAPEASPAPVVEKNVKWELRTQAELVEHIVSHYHANLRRDLPALIDAARRIERDHAAHAAVPRGLADELASFASELESHMLKEETVLFPTLRTGARGGQLDMPIRMMERDHDGHTAGLDRIREHTANLTAPDDASAAWLDLYRGLATLETDLQQHIYLENNILFVRATGERDG